MEAAGRGMLVCLKEEFGMDGPLRMWAVDSWGSSHVFGVAPWHETAVGPNYLQDLVLPLRYFFLSVPRPLKNAIRL